MAIEMQVRGDELAWDERAAPSRILGWLEHARWRALDDRGGLGTLLGPDAKIVVRTQRVLFHRRPRYGETLALDLALSRVGTTSAGFSQTIRQPDGTLLVEAALVAVHLDATGRTAPLPDVWRSRVRPVQHTPELLALEPAGQPPPEAAVWPLVVRPSEIDVFQHVNHARYLDWLTDAVGLLALRGDLPPGFRQRELQAVALSYETDARAGEALQLRLWPEGPDTVAAMITRDQTPLCLGRLVFRSSE